MRKNRILLHESWFFSFILRFPSKKSLISFIYSFLLFPWFPTSVEIFHRRGNWGEKNGKNSMEDTAENGAYRVSEKFLTRVKSRGGFEKVGQQMAHKARGKFCKSTTRWYEATSILEFAIARESGRRGVAMNRLVRLWLLRFIIAQWKGKM